MNTRILFPRLLVACFGLSLAISVAAQTSDPDGRQRSVLSNNISSKLIEAESESVPTTTIEERGQITASAKGALSRFETALSAAMTERLGAYYHYGSIGPGSFDCSGFVWSSFQEAGVKFERGPARSYWARFTPVTKEDQFKFGTLVFFSGLSHIGIVVDERGFYHSSRHNGVVYSPFNDYWLSRIDGFRRVPVQLMQASLVNEKARGYKPVQNSLAVEEDYGPKHR